jgi:hypothetical protein
MKGDLGRSKNKKSLIEIEIVAGKPPHHLDQEMTEKIKIVLKNTETIENHQNIEMKEIKTNQKKEIIKDKKKDKEKETETEIENMMIEEIVETEKEEDQEIKTEIKKNKNLKTPNKSIMTTNYCLIKSPCQSKFLCLPFLENVEEDKDRDLLWVITEEIRTIMKANSGIPFHGYQE